MIACCVVGWWKVLGWFKAWLCLDKGSGSGDALSIFIICLIWIRLLSFLDVSDSFIASYEMEP